jgi:manganese/zinc/iron transport system substrate-binding protein
MKHALVLFALIAVVACGVSQEPAEDPTTGKFTVVATTTIVADAVRQIAGDRVEVVALMGAGVDPHLYKPSAGDVRRLSSADAVFFNGLHLEGKMGEILEQIGERGVPSFAIAECIDEDRLIVAEAGATAHDPHVWFDVALWTTAVTCAAEGLAKVDPDNSPFFADRRRAYVDELVALDAEVRAAVQTIPESQRVLVTAHDAFSYFGRAYDLEVRGLLGISTVVEAGAGDVQDLADFIAERKIPSVFVESSVPPRYIEALREAVAARGHDVAMGGELYSDALGSPGTPAETYVGTVRANVSTIVAALGGEVAS